MFDRIADGPLYFIASRIISENYPADYAARVVAEIRRRRDNAVSVRYTADDIRAAIAMRRGDA